jgi:hypothetical protein
LKLPLLRGISKAQPLDTWVKTAFQFHEEVNFYFRASKLAGKWRATCCLSAADAKLTQKEKRLFLWKWPAGQLVRTSKAIASKFVQKSHSLTTELRMLLSPGLTHSMRIYFRKETERVFSQLDPEDWLGSESNLPPSPPRKAILNPLLEN